MTRKELEQIKRVCGPDFEYSDIPPAIRKREEREHYLATGLMTPEEAGEEEWRDRERDFEQGITNDIMNENRPADDTEKQ